MVKVTRLRPGLLPRLILHDLGLVAAPVAPAQVHAQQHLGPVLGLGAAGSGMKGDDGVPAVVGAAEELAQLHARQAVRNLPETGFRLFQGLGVVLFLGQVQKEARFLDARVALAVVVHGLPEQGLFLEDLLGLVGVVPEVGLGGEGYQFVDSLLLAVDVKDASVAGRACPRSVSVVRVLRQTWRAPATDLVVSAMLLNIAHVAERQKRSRGFPPPIGVEGKLARE